MEINKLTEQVLKLANEKGWVTDKDKVNVPEKIALIHTEIAEAYEAYRKKQIDGPHGFKEELADALIRIFHLCGVFEIDVEKEVLNKLEINKDRDWDWEEINEEHD